MLLTPWEQKLLSAQNVLFNEELFAQVRGEEEEEHNESSLHKCQHF